MADKSHVLRVHPENPEKKIINRAAESIEKGGTVIFPAQYLYGMAADAFSEESVRRIFEIKKRPLQKPLLVLIKNFKQLETLTAGIPEAGEKLMQAFWPGNVTIIFTASDLVPGLVTAGSGRIGIRMPLHPVARALVERLDSPVTGTSANVSEKPGCDSVENLDPAVLENTDLVLDAGRLKSGIGSTLVDVTSEPARIVRQGEIPAEDIFRIIEQGY